MKTQIKQYGNSNVLVLSSDFMKFHNAKVGDWITLPDSIIIESETRELREEMNMERIKKDFPIAYKSAKKNMEKKK